MTQFATASRFQPLREVDAYWEAIRGGRLVPRRSDIDPRGIERALEFAFILERIAPGLGRLRIAGSHMTELMGMEVRGMPLSALFTAGSRQSMSDALEDCFAGPSKVTLTLQAERGIGKPQMSARMILLPLKSDLGDISRVLGCLATAGEIGRAPRRFDLVGTEVRPLLGDAMPVDDAESGDEPVVTEPRRGLAEDPAPFAPAPRPYLRLVASEPEGK